MKKTLLSLIALFIWTIAFAQTEIDGIYYNLNNENKTAEVTYQYYWSSDNYSGITTLTIPSSVTYNSETYNVTSIGNGAFTYCSSLSSITIPNSVTSIGYQAFSYCLSLTSITIPNSVTEIDENAFMETPWLNNQPNGCMYINNLLYKYKGDIPANTHIDVKEGTTQICAYAFSGCSSLTSITIPNSVTSIGENAFRNCEKLTSITIPNSVTSISGLAFYYCSSLSSITIPNSVTSIGYQAFSYCSSLTSITIPNSITSINDYTFEYCSSLTSITIPNSVTSIGYGAFESCSSLTFISLPDSLKSIGDFAFSNCININTIKVDAIIPPTITATSFNNVSRNIEFIVPEEALNAYAEHEYWREFIQGAPNNIENNESENTKIFTQNGTLHINGITTDYQIHTSTGRLIYSGNASTLSLPRGIYLVTINGETQKIVL